jgi:hypothetical protein
MKIGRLNISWTCFRCDDTGGCPLVGKLIFFSEKKKANEPQKENEH